MKRIEAIIKPFKLEEVRGALTVLGIGGITVTEVEDCGWRQSRLEAFRHMEYTRVFNAKIKLEIVVPDDLSGPASEAIVAAALTNSKDDGHIFISQLEEVVTIRKEEKNELARYCMA